MTGSKHQFQPIDNSMDFVDQEEKLLKQWYEKGIVERYLHRNDHSAKKFSFLDGPITANNPMGVHHGWGRTYKDLWQRYFNLRGYKQRFQNGFDCQGLWVEVEVEKELGFTNKRDIEAFGIENFVNRCKERVRKFASIQTDQSKRLGNFMDWENSYYTMSDENNYMIWHFLQVCHQNGWIYKGKDSVPWCPRCQTAISQHEMLTEDYKEVVHKAIYFSYPLTDKSDQSLMVWTTTPWTLPANIAVAVDATQDYALISVENGRQYWLLNEAKERALAELNYRLEKVVKGQELVGLAYKTPFDDLPAVRKVAVAHPDTFHRVVSTDPLILPISSSEGTGMVHTAVSAGAEDFKLGQLRGLPMIPVIDDEAVYLDGLGFLTGQNAKKHPEIILDYMSDLDRQGSHYVFRIENYSHRYPACWRCKTELVWKVADEWYIAMDKPGLKSNNQKTLRERMVEVAKQITWLPDFGLDRELDWLKNMHDWLISKPNRYWGLALPIYECHECGQVEIIGSYDELQAKSATGWSEFVGHSPHKPWIDAVKIKCPQCGQIVPRIPDVGNVWLDAGIVPYSTFIDPETKKLSYLTDKKYWLSWFPAHFITESFPGQFKNWFYSMIAMSTVLEDIAPFKTVLGFASMLGEDGRPMHKSWGNAIEFNEGASKIGVDIMRWVFVRQNPVNNLLFGYKTTSEVRRQFYLIMWNSYRFFVNSAATLNWFPEKKVSFNQSSVLDRWILSRFNQTHLTVESSLDQYDAFHAVGAIEKLISDLSTWYIRRSRDRVNVTSTNHEDRAAALNVMYYLFTRLSIMLAPFMPYISDRIYMNLTGEASVHLASWPQADQNLIDLKLEQEMQQIREIVEQGHAVRKQLGLRTRQPLASITINHPQNQPVNELLHLIAQEMNVKEVKWVKGETLSVIFDTQLTDALKAEGEARELVRQINTARKQAGTRLDELVTVILPTWPQTFTTDIKTKVLAKELRVGTELQIIRD